MERGQEEKQKHPTQCGSKEGGRRRSRNTLPNAGGWRGGRRRSRNTLPNAGVKKGAGGEAETPYPMREDGEGRKDAIEGGRKKKFKKGKP